MDYSGQNFWQLVGGDKRHAAVGATIIYVVSNEQEGEGINFTYKSAFCSIFRLFTSQIVNLALPSLIIGQK